MSRNEQTTLVDEVQRLRLFVATFALIQIVLSVVAVFLLAKLVIE